MYPRILTPPRGSFFLFGPRGTGKSTWLRATFPTAHTFNLLDEALYQSLLADAGLFASEIRALDRGSTVIVDEIQRLPRLLNEVHRHLEERRFRFVLCGSSARKLKKEETNLLAGRAAWRTMHPLLPEELGRDFDLDRVLRWGSLPVVWTAEDPRETLEAYVQLYLKEEIQAEALVRNLPGFARFLPIAALFHGQTINVSSVARDAGVSRTTVAGYFGVLEDTLLGFHLPAFEARLRVRERRHPKFYWADPGIPRAMKKQLGPPVAEERGPLLEGWIAGLLRAYRDYSGLFDDWFYWAPTEAPGSEVDFLLAMGGEYVAIEVKAAKTFSEGLAKGLRAVSGLKKLRRRILVYRGERALRTVDGIDVLPVDRFVEAISAGSLLRRSK